MFALQRQLVEILFWITCFYGYSAVLGPVSHVIRGLHAEGEVVAGVHGYSWMGGISLLDYAVTVMRTRSKPISRLLCPTFPARPVSSRFVPLSRYKCVRCTGDPIMMGEAFAWETLVSFQSLQPHADHSVEWEHEGQVCVGGLVSEPTRVDP